MAMRELQITARATASVCVLLAGLAVLEATAHPQDPGQSYAFLVAAQDYDETELRPLKFARNDVVELAQALAESGFRKENIVLLHDKQERRYHAEGKKIREELDLLLAGVAENDSVVVALAGHGVQFQGDKRSYFCPSDARLGDKATLIAFEEIYKKLEDCPAARKLLLVDACRNDPQSELARATRPDVKLESVTRPQVETVPKGILALFSCAAGQKSFEYPELEHGVFFHHVLLGLRGAAARQGEARITLDDLIRYTRTETQTFARTKLRAIQTPQSKGEFEGVWVLADRAKLPDVATSPPKIAGKSFTNLIGMKLVAIPSAEFLMGSGEPAAAIVDAFKKYEGSLSVSSFDDEFPQHRVWITKPFQIGMHEVTMGQFRQFVQAENYKTEAERDGKGGWGYDASSNNFEQSTQYSWQNTGWPQGDDYPVVNVTWNDAVAFCAWLSRKEGRTYRLPTEAEWEYACRAGSTSRYSFGDDPELLAAYGNVADGTAKEKLSLPWAISARDGYVFTAPVGKFKPNAFGVFDMHGNVWEWCQDFYDAKYYEKRVDVDPLGPSSKSENRRVLRGGSWYYVPWYTRSTFRYRYTPVNRLNDMGFRVVCVSLP